MILFKVSKISLTGRKSYNMPHLQSVGYSIRELSCVIYGLFYTCSLSPLSISQVTLLNPSSYFFWICSSCPAFFFIKFPLYYPGELWQHLIVFASNMLTLALSLSHSPCLCRQSWVHMVFVCLLVGGSIAEFSHNCMLRLAGIVGWLVGGKPKMH